MEMHCFVHLCVVIILDIEVVAGIAFHRKLHAVCIKHSASENCLSKATDFIKSVLNKEGKLERVLHDGRSMPGKERHMLLKCSFYYDKTDI